MMCGSSTRLMTMGVEGEELRCVSDHVMTSHYDWNDKGEIIAWARRNEIGERYYLFDESNGSVCVIGEGLFDGDGHCTFSPDGQWMLTDTYPNQKEERTLMMYHFATNRRIDLGSFYSIPLPNELRCDLHPRWSRDGKQICIDSTHEGIRQMYVLYLVGVI